MAEYECVPDFTRTRCPWIAYDSLFQFLHEYLMHLSIACTCIMFDIDEWDVLADLRDDDTVLVWCHSECGTCC